MSRWPLLVVGLVLALAIWSWPRDAAVPHGPGDARARDAATAAPAQATADPAAAASASPLDGERSVATIEHELRGRVVDEAGAPVARVPIHVAADRAASPWSLLLRAQRGEREPVLASGSSEHDGTFRLVVPAANTDEPLQVHALPEHHGDTALRRVRVAGASTVLPDLVVRAERPVRVLVIDDATEQPIAGATVRARPAVPGFLALPGRERGRTAVTDADGAAAVPGLPAGNWTFRAEAPGYAANELPPQSVQSDEPTEIQIALAAGLSLGGHVVDAAGRPVADAHVEAQPRAGHLLARVAARTDAFGRFVLAGLAAGELRVVIGRSGFQTLVQEPVAAGGDGLVFALRPQGAIRLAVVDASGAPRAPFAVTARPVGSAAGMRERPRRVVAAAEVPDGTFVLDDLDPGAWTLTVEAAGAAPTPSDPIDVREGAIADARVVLQAGATVRLRLVASDGRPAARARVLTQPDGFLDGPAADVLAPLAGAAAAAVGTVADAAGRALLAHVPAGRWQLRVDTDGQAPCYVRGVAVGAADVDLGVVALPKTTRLSGSALVAGAVDATVVVQVLALAGSDLPQGFRTEARVDAAGNWRCALGLPAGRYAVMAGRRRADDPFLENQDAAASRVEVELAGDAAEHRVDLVLARGGS